MHPHQNSVLGIASHPDVLKYLAARFQEQRRLLTRFDLGIGCFENVITVTEQTPLIDVLDALALIEYLQRVLDSKEGTLKDILFKLCYILGKDCFKIISFDPLEKF